MQQQICPRCKFRLTSAKAICNTCGYALQNVRKGPEAAAPVAPKMTASAPKAAQPMISQSSVSNTSSQAASLRKTQASAPSGGSFWRAFFGLDPLPTDKSDRDDRAFGET
jgi:predicted amidophosphoribosyltransferase